MIVFRLQPKIAKWYQQWNSVLLMATKQATVPYVRVEKKRPRGDVTAQAEIMLRVAIVEDLMAEHRSTPYIVDECTRKWNCSAVTVQRYMQRVRERWIEEREGQRGTDLERTLARLTRLARKLEAKKAWAALMQAEKLIADLLGVRAPEKHDHRVAAVVQQIAPQSVSLEVLETLSDGTLDELERAADKRLALAAPAPAAPPVLTVIDVPSDE